MSTQNNFIAVKGNLVRDPELRFTNSGTPVANFRVAVTDRYQDRSGDWKERTTFVDVVAWQGLGEHVAASLVKGDRVSVQGRLDIRSYEAEGGERRYFTEIVASDVAPSLQWADARPQREERPVTAGAPDDGEEPF